MVVEKRCTLVLGLLGLVAVLFCTVDGQCTESQIPAHITKWLIGHAIAFETTDPTVAPDDLESLRSIVGEARIVGLGEQTHGTKEFFDMKHRILRFLVEEMGFTIFAMEADWAAAQKVDDYILGKTMMPPAMVIRQLGYWTWSTEEVVAMVRWMREYNDHRGESPPIRFVGADIIPQTVESVGNILIDYLTSVDESVVQKATSLWQRFEQAHTAMLDSLPMSSTSLEVCASSLNSLKSMLDENRDAYILASSLDEFALVTHALQIAAWHAQRISLMDTDHSAASASVRDMYIAENTRWWLERFCEEARMVLWAHNFHVGRNPSPEDAWISCGRHLDQFYGSDYLPIAFAFSYGQYMGISRKLGTCDASPFKPNSYEAAFATTSLSHFLLDLRELEPESSPWEWMGQERPFRQIGTLCAEWTDEPSSLPLQFDVLIYIEDSTPAVQLRR